MAYAIVVAGGYETAPAQDPPVSIFRELGTGIGVTFESGNVVGIQLLPSLLPLLKKFPPEQFGELVASVPFTTGPEIKAARPDFLNKLHHLTDLSFRYTDLNDNGLVHVRQLKGLEYLDLSGTCVGDKGLANLCELDNLKHLNLSGTTVSDAGLSHIEGLAGLIVLELSGTRITDGGLERLQSLKNLKEVYLYETKVSPEGVRQLSRILSHTDIWIDGTESIDAQNDFVARKPKVCSRIASPFTREEELSDDALPPAVGTETWIFDGQKSYRLVPESIEQAMQRRMKWFRDHYKTDSQTRTPST